VHIERLACTQWRNLADQTIEFSPGVNLLIGENGHGKTNILEAIQFFKFGRSFRTHRDTELIRFGESFCRAEVSAVFGGGDRDRFAAAIETNGNKKVSISDNDVIRMSELVGRYPCVLFGPQDISIVSGEPALRRRFVDSVGSMTDTAFIRAAREYQRVLRQRNAALKARVNDAELNAWNEQIISAGTELIERRRRLVAVLEQEVQARAVELGAGHAFRLRYESTLLRDADRMAAGVGGEADPPSLADVFAMKLGALESEERRRMTTLAGPHRDDVALRLDGHDLRKYGSQGQRRLFAILLKLAELSHLERELKEKCVLLLDDVFSEFDRDVTARLQTVFDGTRQVLVTSPVDLEWAGNPGQTRVLHIRAGTVAT